MFYMNTHEYVKTLTFKCVSFIVFFACMDIHPTVQVLIAFIRSLALRNTVHFENYP